MKNPKEEPKKEYVKCTCDNSLEYSNCGKKCERILDEQETKQESCEFIKEFGCIKDVCTCNKRQKQETLEEAFKLFKEEYPILKSYNLHHLLQVARFGAKWQQKQDKNKYSEDEVLDIFHEWFCYRIDEDFKIKLSFQQWFEKFKKK